MPRCNLCPCPEPTVVPEPNFCVAIVLYALAHGVRLNHPAFRSRSGPHLGTACVPVARLRLRVWTYRHLRGVLVGSGRSHAYGDYDSDGNRQDRSQEAPDRNERVSEIRFR